MYSTPPVKAGGKNPVFNQSLQIPIPRPDAVLKCEIWMMSCARNYLEDQLLGFVLVSLADLFGKGKRTQDYALTSTDIFYTPAGTVCLSLLFHSLTADLLENTPSSSSSIAMSDCGEEGMMDCGQQCLAPADLSKVEFPDLEAASENQRLVSVYVNMSAVDTRSYHESNGGLVPRSNPGQGAAPKDEDLTGAPSLQLGASAKDCEMSSLEEEKEISPDSRGLYLLSHTSPSSVNQCHEEVPVLAKSTLANSVMEHICGETQAPISNSPTGRFVTDNHLLKFAQSASSSSSSVEPSHSDMHENQDKGNAFATSQESQGSAFTAPPIDISVGTQVPVVRQHIEDMYTNSMQRFTEKLAEMSLPLDIDAQDSTVFRNMRVGNKSPEEGKKEGTKVFYGSRAFF